jgi:hypothetical protein
MLLQFQKRSPQDVPNMVLSHMVYPKFNSHVYNLKRLAVGCTSVSIWQLGVQRSVSTCGVHNLQRIDDGPTNMAPFQNEKEKV